MAQTSQLRKKRNASVKRYPSHIFFSLCSVLCSLSVIFITAGCKSKTKTADYPDSGTPDAAYVIAIYSASPSSGPLEGGTSVSISGSGFVEGMTVFFASNQAESVTVTSSGSLTCVTPEGSEAGPVNIRLETPDGFSTQLMGGFVYEDRSAVSIDWCIFHAPQSTSTQIQTVTEPLYGRVFAEGVTDRTGQGPGITAQVGFGPAGTDPAVDSGWSWTSAVYYRDVDTVNDEYAGNLTPVHAGQYDMAYRFNGGGAWIYCDLTGSDDGYSPQNAPSLTVEDSSEPMVDWCILHYPPALETGVNTETDLLYGHVFKLGVTEGPGAGAGVVGEAGFGPSGTHPGSDPGWQWTTAQYNPEGPAGNNDEYMVSFLPTSAGDYDYAFRFSFQNGPWTYCDLNGTDDGYSSDFAGKMKVTGEGEGLVDWCNLQYPLQTETMVGVETELIFGRVYLEGSTPGAGQGGGIIGELGYGDPSTNPSTDPAGWQWINAEYNMSVDGLIPGDLANDEYMAALTINQEGVFAYAYRFSRDGGITWLYCDADGSDNGYDPDKGGVLQVTDATAPRIDHVTPPFGSVLGGNTVVISGEGFSTDSTVLFGSEPAMVQSASANEIECVIPAHVAGLTDLTVTNPGGAFYTLEESFEYVHVATINVDGNPDDWDPALRAAQNNITTDAPPGYLSELYIAFDDENLYIGITGFCEPLQSIILYLDVDYGSGTGVSDTQDLSDNTGALDDAISGTLFVDDPLFGAEFAAGTIGMAEVADGLADSAGLRKLNPPYDFPWLSSTVSTSSDFIEIALPLSHLWPGSIPPNGARAAIVVKLLNDAFGVDYSNQTLPEDSGSDTVSSTAAFTVYPL